MIVVLKLDTAQTQIAINTFAEKSADDYYTKLGFPIYKFGSWGYSHTDDKNVLRYTTCKGNMWEVNVSEETLTYSGVRGAMWASIDHLIPDDQMNWESVKDLPIVAYHSSNTDMWWFECLGTYLVRTEDKDGLLDYLPEWGNKRMDKKNVEEALYKLGNELRYALKVIYGENINEALFDGTGIKYRQ